jgi:ribonuclease VapC
MIVDTSALIAILRGEPDGEALLDRLLRADVVRISAGTLQEARMVAERDAGADELAELLALADTEVVPVDEHLVDLATEGFRRFGKGRHPAGLNFGGCFAYALARACGEPLLFKGDDFSRTDLAPLA